MKTYTSIIGSAVDTDIAEALHALAHRGRVDTVLLTADDIRRHRLRARTQAGDECGIVLDRQTHLFDGAVLRLDADGALVVKTETTRWLRLRPCDPATALELGYFAGNMHWAVRFDGAVLEIALKGSREEYLARLAPLLASGNIGEVITEAEVNASADADFGAHEHGDTHAHKHAHAADPTHRNQDTHRHKHQHGHDHTHAHTHDHGHAEHAHD